MTVASLTNVRKQYPGVANATLEDVSLSVEQGEFLAITGPSGAGKSTLLNIVGLLDRATSGSYQLLGEDCSAMSERRRTWIRAHRIGFVFQVPHVLPDESVLSNAALGLRACNLPLGERHERARILLERVGLSHLTSAQAKTLSGGEAQRLAIARALATQPILILADEPTGSLDTSNGALVIDLLKDLQGEEGGLVLITHDPTIAARADRTIRILDGRLVA